MTKVGDYLTSYVNSLGKELGNLDISQVEKLVDIISEAYKNNGRIYVCGNGGSAAAATHLVAHLKKGAAPKGERLFEATCLTDNIPVLTAWSNDTSYMDAFKNQLTGIVGENDLVIAISGSGNSENVLNAIAYAKEKGAKTVGLTGNYKGMGGGKLAELAEFSIVVPTESMERIEDMHTIIIHAVKDILPEHIKSE